MKKSLKGDRTLLLTSLLLFFMLAAGIASGVVGFISGHEALKGVTQPDIRPNNTKGTSGQNANTKGLELIKEQEVIANVKKQMGIEDPSKDAQMAKDAKKQAADFEKAVQNDPKSGIPNVKLPLLRDDQGIQMSINAIDYKNNSVKITMTLTNNGSQPVNFGQGAMAVSNGTQNISAAVIGIPNSLVANGKPTKVVVTVPKSAIDKAKSISLQLTDIDKKLQLDATGIPTGKK